MDIGKGILVAITMVMASMSFSAESVAGTAAIMGCESSKDPYCHDVPYSPPGSSCTGETCDSKGQICCIG